MIIRLENEEERQKLKSFIDIMETDIMNDDDILKDDLDLNILGRNPLVKYSNMETGHLAVIGRFLDYTGIDPARLKEIIELGWFFDLFGQNIQLINENDMEY